MNDIDWLYDVALARFPWARFCGFHDPAGLWLDDTFDYAYAMHSKKYFLSRGWRKYARVTLGYGIVVDSFAILMFNKTCSKFVIVVSSCP